MDQVKEAAKLLGSIGGKRNTLRQNQARAENGKRGGRPRISTDKIIIDKPERSGKLDAC